MLSNFVGLCELRSDAFIELFVADLGISIQIDPPYQSYQFCLCEEDSHVPEESPEIPRIQVAVAPIVNDLEGSLHVEVILSLKDALDVLALDL